MEAIQGKLFGVSLYPTLSEKASAIATTIAREHVFLDGNKRTAFEALAQMLELNGYTIVAEDDQIVEVFEALAADDLQFDDLVQWVRENAVQLGVEG